MISERALASAISHRIGSEPRSQSELIPRLRCSEEDKDKMGSNDLNAPFLSIPGVLNFRDIGGYPIASQPGKEVRRGVVYRSAEPSQITNAGREKIQQLGITVAYDLRSEREVSRSHRDVPLDEFIGVKRILAPVFRDGDYSPEASKPTGLAPR